MAEEKVLKLPRQSLMFIGQWLDIPLKGVDSKNRNLFIDMLKPFAQEIEQLKLDIQKRYAEKEADGSIKQERIVFPNGSDGTKVIMSPENEVKANKEFNDLMAADFVIKIVDFNEGIIYSTKKIIHTIGENMQFKAEDGRIFGLVEDAFEAL